MEAVFREFRACEMSTLARDGSPITWPTLATVLAPGEGRFLTGTRRNARRYLRKRGLPRPRVPWEAVIAIKAQARAGKHTTETGR